MTQVAQFNPQQGFRAEQIEALQAIIHEDQIRERKGGGGKMLKYIKGDMGIDTANRIFGYGQWGYRVTARSHEVIIDEKKGRIEFYTADIELSVVGAAFPFPGDGVGIVNAPFTVEMHEKARKEATTDAMKRALRHYGDQFGLSLYNEDDPIEGRDGTIKPVKAAEVRNHPVPERRVVESAAPRQLPAASPVNSEPARITEQQIASIRKLCEHLGKPELEDLERFSYLDGKTTINQLSTEYRDMKSSQPQTAAPAQPSAARAQSGQPKAVLDMIARAQQRAERLQLLWDDVKRDTFAGRCPADDTLTVQQVAQINGVLTVVEKGPKSA